MSSDRPLRYPRLLAPGDSVLAVIDVQERLWPVIAQTDRILPRMRLVAESAKLLDVPIVVTQQYTKGLGPTIEPLRPFATDPIEKITFSSAGEQAFLDRIGRPQIRKVLVVGIETHVCVLQTCLDLLAHGYEVQVCVDAVGSRSIGDRDAALRRLEAEGVLPTTAEAAAFEWLERADHPRFKEVSALVKQHAAAP